MHRINAPEGKAPFGATERARHAAVRRPARFSRTPSKGRRRCSTGRSGRRSGGQRSGIEGARRRRRRSAPTRPARSASTACSSSSRTAACRSSPASATSAPSRCSTSIASPPNCIGVPWEKCDVTWGNTSKNLPNTCGQGGSQTTHAMTRAAHAGGMDAMRKLQEIAAKTLGGTPESYTVANERGFERRPRPDVRAGGAEGDRARRQVRRPRTAGRHQRLHAKLGDGARGAGADGRGEGQLSARRRVEVVRRRVRRSGGRRRDRTVPGARASSRSRTVGTVIHPRSLGGQICGGIMLGLGHAIGQQWVYDQHYGVPLAKRFYNSKPPTILDAPAKYPVGRARHAPIRKRRSARAAWARRRSAPGSARSSTRLPRRSATTCSGARRSRRT